MSGNVYKGFLEGFNEREETNPECGQHHPRDGLLDQVKRRKQDRCQHPRIPASLVRCGCFMFLLLCGSCRDRTTFKLQA